MHQNHMRTFVLTVGGPQTATDQGLAITFPVIFLALSPSPQLLSIRAKKQEDANAGFFPGPYDKALQVYCGWLQSV